jgi:hypothetical protein
LTELGRSYGNDSWRNAVKDKTADLLADAFEGMLAEHGLSAANMVGALLGVPIPPKHKKFARIGLKAGMRPMFKKLPEPTKEQMSEVLATLEVLKRAPQKMRKIFMQTAKQLPHALGGPPRKIQPEKERTVCTEILALRDEYDTREAIRRVAAKWDVSDRTIYRIWGKFHPKKKRIQAAPRS